DKKYERVLDRIKTRLLDLEIQGKHEKLTLLKSLDELINDEVKRGTSTVILVGNDKTFQKVVDVATKNKVTLGIIPVGPDNNIAESFGISDVETACDIIAARKIISFDLGKVNDFYFFSDVKLVKNLSRLNIVKDSYKILPKPECVEVSVSNFYFPRGEEPYNSKMNKYSAQDNKIELLIRTEKKKKNWFKKKQEKTLIDTIISSDYFEINSFEYLPATIDDYKVIKTPLKLSIAKEKLKVIAGKNRLSHIE
ncbi:hypothetical protein HOB30_02845, partial [Candidatus Falkowbacteria bacterium]|nr:hypothetical protein [Candidatus Falkowbacteria bacterium]